ncbi:YmiA family putative membrane protein [Acerihabitans sp. TG2]
MSSHLENHDLKRKTWITLFLLCSVFWMIIGLLAYHLA